MRVYKLTFAGIILAALIPAALAGGSSAARFAFAQVNPDPQDTQQPHQPRPRRAGEPDAPQAATTPTPPPPASKGESVRDDEVLSVETNLVNVLFNAVDRERRFVTTLKQEDIRVYENDQPQEITLFQRETELPLSIVILIDVSASQMNTLPDEKDAANIFVDSILRSADRAAVISFTGTATIEQDLTNDKPALHRAINRLEAVPPPEKEEEYSYLLGEKEEVPPPKNDEYGLPGSTALWDAVWATAGEVMAQTSQQSRRAIIIVSDGADSTSRLKREDAVEAAVRANTVVYSIGIGDYEFDAGALKKVSEKTGGRAFFPEDEGRLNAAFAQIQQELRTQYLVAYSPTNKARDGSWRKIRIEVVNPKLRDEKIKLTYREGYFATPPQSSPRLRPTRTPEERLKRPPRKPRKK